MTKLRRIVDLSLDIYDKAPTFWPDPKTSMDQHLKIENLGYNIHRLVISTHLGTHLDAPFHFLDQGRTVDALDIRKGFGPGWVLDFTDKKAGGRISSLDLDQHAAKISAGARIIIKTGWDKVFPDSSYFADPPGLAVDACRRLADAGIACVALDTPTVCMEFMEAHHALLGAEVLIVEGLANLDRLTSERVLFQAIPLRIRGGDGSPCRAIAIEGLSEAELEILEGIETA